MRPDPMSPFQEIKKDAVTLTKPGSLALFAAVPLGLWRAVAMAGGVTGHRRPSVRMLLLLTLISTMTKTAVFQQKVREMGARAKIEEMLRHLQEAGTAKKNIPSAIFSGIAVALGHTRTRRLPVALLFGALHGGLSYVLATLVAQRPDEVRAVLETTYADEIAEDEAKATDAPPLPQEAPQTPYRHL